MKQIIIINSLLLALVLLLPGCGKSRHEQYIETRDKYQDSMKEFEGMYHQMKSISPKQQTKLGNRVFEFREKNPSATHDQIEAFEDKERKEIHKETLQLIEDAGKQAENKRKEIEKLKAKMESLRD